jgi:hypothetical protein
MKLKCIKSTVSGLIVGLVLSASAAAKDDFPEVTKDGLRKIADTELSLVYAKDGVDLGVYDKVWLADATIAFKKNWKRDQNRNSSARVSTSDMERIKTQLAELFLEVFTEKLTGAGHELVSAAGEDVLVVRPAILNLDVSAPDIRSTGRNYQLTESAGEMTLYIELYDSATGDHLVTALDRQADRRGSNFQWQTKASNRAAAKKMIGSWADTLIAALADAKITATGSGEEE